MFLLVGLGLVGTEPADTTIAALRADGDATRAIACTVPQYTANKPEVWPNSWEGAIMTRSAIDTCDCVQLKRFDQGWYLAAN
ncbi:hypothetical protein HZY97_11045 [Sphingomonas sp. R-74633]|uniref:hypothetical protein n=1 Tax=Sphingomonas sp. R-74633 TaxID=2751188 RepID=UPI0015D31534|nr:hypothetical protein [Sphingomonas sp. R-74633]NYT41296.1 hypothetical protein [Sphingomonas sp. R-74633]